MAPSPSCPDGGRRRQPLSHGAGRLDLGLLPWPTSLYALCLAVVTADHVCMRRGLRPPCCAPLSSSSAKPCLPATPHQLQVPSLAQEVVSTSYPPTSQPPQLICSGQSHGALPASTRRTRTPPAPLAARPGRQLSPVPASGWGSPASWGPQASHILTCPLSSPTGPPSAPSPTCTLYNH